MVSGKGSKALTRPGLVIAVTPDEPAAHLAKRNADELVFAGSVDGAHQVELERAQVLAPLEEMSDTHHQDAPAGPAVAGQVVDLEADDRVVARPRKHPGALRSEDDAVA